jgi:hypothetical protein
MPSRLRAVGRDDLKRLVAFLDAKVKRGHTVNAQGQRRPSDGTRGPTS